MLLGGCALCVCVCVWVLSALRKRDGVSDGRLAER